MSRPSIRDNNILIIPVIINDGLHTGPRILNIIKISPQITVVNDGTVIWGHSRIYLIHRPTAGVDHLFASSVQMVSKLGVAAIHLTGMRVASV